jgi:hypothetical protein
VPDGVVGTAQRLLRRAKIGGTNGDG